MVKERTDIFSLRDLSERIIEYAPIEEFVAKHNRMSYVEFDYFVVNDITLFTVEPDFMINDIEITTKRIIAAMNALKRIFSKPIIILRELEEVLPVESVRRINNDTMLHISRHSELWDNIEQESVKPTKLLTTTYKDHYGTYENLIFCELVDDILHFTRRSIRFIKDLMYSSQAIQFNVLERLNHLNYFLALGKLHTGYIRTFDQFYISFKDSLERLNYIYQALTPRLKSPVYRLNRKRPQSIELRRTMIFAVQKDYHQVYLLKKFFESETKRQEKRTIPGDEQTLACNYYYYCEILAIFSIGHFNFTCETSKKFDLGNINMEFSFKNWTLTLSNELVADHQVLFFDFSKEKVYRIAIIPYTGEEYSDIYDLMKTSFMADEYLICTPFEQDYTESDLCYLSISSIDSFRRLQQLLLRGMILSDEKRDECPFCRAPLKVKKDHSYECESCGTQIIEKICPVTSKTYTYTNVTSLQYRGLKKNQFSKDDRWLYQRQIEDQMHFRNITKIDEGMGIICPHCHQKHFS